MIDLRNTSNLDGFEKFVIKLCGAKGGWESLRSIFLNANYLQEAARKEGFEWPQIIEIEQATSKTSDLFLEGWSTGVWKEEGDISILKQYLAEFGVWGITTMGSKKNGVTS